MSPVGSPLRVSSHAALSGGSVKTSPRFVPVSTFPRRAPLRRPLLCQVTHLGVHVNVLWNEPSVERTFWTEQITAGTRYRFPLLFFFLIGGRSIFLIYSLFSGFIIPGLCVSSWSGRKVLLVVRVNSFKIGRNEVMAGNACVRDGRLVTSFQLINNFSCGGD